MERAVPGWGMRASSVAGTGGTDKRRYGRVGYGVWNKLPV
jgi:hypothetical protein